MDAGHNPRVLSLPRSSSAALALVVAMLAVPATAGAAKIPVTVGIGDQSREMFAQPAFQKLGLERVRYFIHWDAVRDPTQLQFADFYIDAAQRQGVKVFLHISTEDLRRKKGTLPSYRLYRREVGRLIDRMRSRWGSTIEAWGVWNEANHDSQPTYKSPSRAASYFKAMYQECEGCKIVALDVLDQGGVESYIRRFYKALGSTYRKRARYVGIHNYSDTNRKRSSGTRDIIQEVKKRDNRRTYFWLTETGGVVKFGKSFPCSENRAKYRIRYMFSLAKKYRRDVQRLYAYNWAGGDCKIRFDSGLTDRDGTPRRGYYEFLRQIRSFRT